ncbi:MAG: phosphatase PAP2 family protein [Gemmatimonadales bacterium]
MSLFRRFGAGFAALLLSWFSAASVQAQTADTLDRERPFFVAGDAALVGGFTLLTILAAPADRHVTTQLQDEGRQANHSLNRSATIFRLLGHPGGLITGGGLYAGGLLAGNRRTEDLGLHTMESILLANSITFAIKVTAGRARPRKSPENARDFQLLRGLHDDEYRSFPSGHATAAFAFASIVTSETSRWWPDSKWVIGPIVYGGAALTGVSRIYNNAHWASDVVAGAAIGTLTGLKVYTFTHSHPNNRIDKFFLRAGVQMSNNGSVMPIMSMVSR